MQSVWLADNGGIVGACWIWKCKQCRARYLNVIALEIIVPGTGFVQVVAHQPSAVCIHSLSVPKTYISYF